VFRLVLDADANIYLAGSTISTNFPTRNAISATNHGSADVFVTKLDSSGTNILYSTYLGGTSVEEGWGITVDAMGSAYVVGETFSTNFFMANAFQATNSGGADAFLLKLSPIGTAIESSTLIGGSGADYGYSVGLDGDGNAYVVGQTGSADFPIVPSTNGFQNAFGGGTEDGFIARIFLGSAVLRVERGTVNDVAILWPKALLSFELQSTDLLMETNNWISVTDNPIVSGNDNSITFSNTAAQRIFRLRRNP